MEDNVSTLEANVSALEVELTDLEAKVLTLEASLEEANDDVETQQKLIGHGVYAEWTYPDGTNTTIFSGFFLTNPDGVSEITIERISVFAYDGTVVYEGPLRVKVGDDGWGE